MTDNLDLKPKELGEKRIESRQANLGVKREKQSEVVEQAIKHEQREQQEEQSEALSQDLHETDSKPSTTTQQQSTTAPSAKSEIAIQIENALAQDLGDIYTNMEPSLKLRFKQKGEEVAAKIETMVATGKIRTKQIVNWIKEWLKMIPGINRFFLEQEAKIKTDRILAMVG